MNKKVKKIALGFLFLFIVLLIFLRIGTFVTQHTNIQGNFIGTIAYDTDVYDLSDSNLGVHDANMMWFRYIHGAPGPFQVLESLQIKKIEILESDWDKREECGTFYINVYTRYNKLIFDNYRLFINCP